jgi:hypothetical protein
MISNTHQTVLETACRNNKNSLQGILLPGIDDRQRWETLDPKLKKALVEEGEKCQKEPWTEFLLSDYREFKKSGDRKKFEDKYFARRYKLNGMILAECVENKGRFLEDIIDGIYLILQEVSWCLPPHNSYYRDEPQLEIPDVTRPVLDLFAAETGALLKCAVTVLASVLDPVSTAIRTAVEDALEVRVIEPFCSWHFWWMGRDGEEMCNWTPWIIQNVLLSIFPGREAMAGPAAGEDADTREQGSFGPDLEKHSGYPEPLMEFDAEASGYRKRYYDTEEKLRKILIRSARAVDYFLDGYEEDGCCEEGAQYYSHAGLCLFGCMDLMNRILRSSMEEAFTTPKIRNIANYICKMHVGGPYYFNFADCSPFPGRRGSRDYQFAKAVKDPVFASFAAKDYRESKVSEKIMASEINLYYRINQVFTHEAMMKEPEVQDDPEDVFLKSQGMMICRDSRFTLAAKAGDNGDSHNHNDVGSITLYKDGKPFLIDLGVETYSAKTFSNRRYEIWTMQSRYHNLPNFRIGDTADGELIMQRDGEVYAARNVNCELGKDTQALAMNIAPAYGREEIRSYLRTVRMIKEDRIEIEDIYEGEPTCELSLMTYEPVVVENQTGNVDKNPETGVQSGEISEGAVIRVGDLGTIAVEGAISVHVEEVPITDERLQIAWWHSCYLTVLKMKDKNLKLVIK